MRVFIDFEASSLGKKGYPIEVGWVFEDGRSENWLIRPPPEWTDWDEEAEAIHGIARITLLEEGTPVEAVAQRLLSELGDHRVYASAPSWDGKWLSQLLRGAGLPRHALRLKDTEEARAETAREVLSAALPEAEVEAAVARVLARAAEAARGDFVSHKAVEDAERERQVWLEVARLAEEEACTGGGLA
jgi:3-hydroxyacyl-CoA dehydrogenase